MTTLNLIVTMYLDYVYIPDPIYPPFRDTPPLPELPFRQIDPPRQRLFPAPYELPIEAKSVEDHTNSYGLNYWLLMA